ncbi:ATP-binding protein [Terriglobus albidus]|uniref:ATP-binding protein n=1 Tax=Terriglobus albidus TaxID=1592106 RepID=UPI0021E0D68C|nr:ATP-binding protein [Terriglobus albidus]
MSTANIPLNNSSPPAPLLAPSTRHAPHTPHAPHAHAVQFYEEDTALLDNITRTIGAALGSGGAGIVIATEAHRVALAGRLSSLGIDLALARRQGRYVALDAADTLDQFMVDSHPDPERFRTVIGDVITRATRATGFSNPSVAAFGEMVALLWADSNPTAAIELERLWNAIALTHHFSLLCGYSLSTFGDDRHDEAFRLVCAEHSHVIPAETYTALLTEDERHRAISLLQHKAELLNQTRRTIQQQEDRLRKTEKLAAAGQLAASLAHEINNPLSSVINVLYLLKNAGLDPTTHALVETADSELARVARIVRQSLSYYRIGTVPRELDLSTVVDESISIYREKAARTCIHLSSRITPALRIVGFGDELRQVIDNLLLNAIEATPQNGRIIISLHPARRWSTLQPGVRLTIADTGSGIPRTHLARIFEPFFTTKAEKGTGLGLWVVSGIVAKHDGHINVRTSEHPARHGTVITIFFPSTLPTR